MKTLLNIFCILSTFLICYADITPNSVLVKVITNDVVYSRRGNLGDNNYVVTDLIHTNFLKRGTNMLVEMDDEESTIVAKEPLYGTGIEYMRRSESSAKIINPYTQDSVYAYWIAFQLGFEYANVEGKYDCIREKYNGSNAAYMWTTNHTNGINGKKVAFPRPEATNDITMLYQNCLNEEVGIIADREWIIQILKAQNDGKLSISYDSNTKKYSISISK